MYHEYVFDGRYWRGGNTDRGARPYGFSHYHEGTNPFSEWASGVADLVDNGRVLVVGCGLGYTVRELRGRGIDATGMDISDWAVENAVTDHVAKGDVFAPTVRGPFELVYDECLLSCLTDGEAVDACRTMRQFGDQVAHRLWSFPDDDHGWYNVKSRDEWRRLCDPDGEDRWL